MSAPIVPALIPVSEVAVKQAAETLLFSPEFHLDVVDGVFVPSMSWPIDPAGDPLTVKPWLDQYTLEVDLMVTDPLTQASEWVVAGADMLVFHAETVELASLRDFVEFTTVSVGVSVNGATTTETLLQYAEVADYVQLMGIYEIGAQGQPFYEGIFDQLAAVTNFLITPLAFLSGTFYSIHRLPEPFFTASQLNPFFYLIDRKIYQNLTVLSLPLCIKIQLDEELFDIAYQKY